MEFSTFGREAHSARFMFSRITIDYGGINFPLPFREDKLYVGFVAVFSGCKRAIQGNPCPDCQNPSLWSFENGGDINNVESYIRKRFRNIFRIAPEIEFFYCVLGGEPLDQDVRELELIHDLVEQGCGCKLTSVLFTGYDEIPCKYEDYISRRINFVKLGPYLGNDKRENNLPSGLATRNQQWKVIACSKKTNSDMQKNVYMSTSEILQH